MADSISGMLGILQSIEHELLVFAVFFFVLGTIDELAIDLLWIWFRLTGRAKSRAMPDGLAFAPLRGRAAVLIPAWQEAEVIGSTIIHMLKAWRQAEFTVYVGCYRNDPDTIAAVMAAAGNDPRVRLVVHGSAGPTTKADCLNRLYRAIEQDEVRRSVRFRSVLLHDAEDMVHPAGLAAIDRALQVVDFVQLPVRPEPQRRSRLIAGHYSDEFCEAHAKTMVVRDILTAGIPAAGVGCGLARDALDQLCEVRKTEGESGPFAPQCLTEDYEFGLLLSRYGRGSSFLRLRDARGDLVATRSYFPADLGAAVRQKTRWMHGIALQGWERLGWSRRPVDFWMALRDRRAPLISLVLAAAFALLVIELVLQSGRWAGYHTAAPAGPVLQAMIAVSLFGLVWRALFRVGFTAMEYGLREGLLALVRIPVANVIAIMAGRRAVAAYIRTLLGETAAWEKTAHSRHPAQVHAATLVDTESARA